MENKNSPAYPLQYEEEYGDYGKTFKRLQEGLTKRELAAFMAMQGLCSNSVPGRHHMPDNLTDEAIEIADLMIKKLAQ